MSDLPTIVAEVRTRSRQGEVFLAESLEVADGLATAAGHYVRPLGPDRQLVRAHEVRSWPLRELRQVKRLEGAA